MSANIVAFPEQPIRPDMAFVREILADANHDICELWATARVAMRAADCIRENQELPDRQRRVVTSWAIAAFCLLEMIGVPLSVLEDIDLPPTS